MTINWDSKTFSRYPFKLTNKQKTPICQVCKKYDAYLYCCSSEKMLCTICHSAIHKQNCLILFKKKRSKRGNDFFLDIKVKSQPKGIQALCTVNNTNKEFIECIIKNGFKIDQWSHSRQTPLHHICSSFTTIEIIDLFIENGFDINTKNNNGLCFFACSLNDNPNFEIIQHLHSKGAKIDIDDYYIQKKLFNAFLRIIQKNPSVEICKCFVKFGMDINHCCDQNGDSNFCMLCEICPNVEILKFFIDNGANLEIKDWFNHNCLFFLCRSEKPTVELIQLFIDRGMDVKELDKNNNDLLFTLCSNNPTIDTISLLVKHGLDIKKKCSRNLSLFYTASHCETIDLKLVNFFLDLGFDLGEKNKDGRSILHNVSRSKNFNLDLFKLFVDKGIDLNQKKNNNTTVLMYYCTGNSQIEIMQLFLDHGADVNFQNINGKTAFHFLVEGQQNIQNMNFFLKNGYNLNLADKKNSTPFHILLTRNPTIEVIKWFLKNQIDLKKISQDYGNVFYIYLTYNKKINLDILYEFLQRGVNLNNQFRYDQFKYYLRGGNPDIGAIKIILKNMDNSHHIFNMFSVHNYPIEFKFVELGVKGPEHYIPDLKLDMSKKHRIKKSIQQLFLDESSKDFAIILKNNKQIKVHKLILVVRSALFREMFKNIKDPNITQINDYTGKSINSFNVLIKYLYTEEIDKNDLNDEIVGELQDSIEYFQLNPKCDFLYSLNQK
ncbi:phytochrome-interacting ankyrin-repeat protein 1-related [Anaeramoeba flamelloides]|uniref:Phytochrome-interacting ankyrin-repeat protein 1-related n=1 Tax=Anaeramoeba flamelloides TaxID=1746091 RepID=A0AAV8A1Y7_9EUKA|nr:phytochrome-interacting ankyrin-repeat protein 1-related [Anaeramoeba flamelloides]